MTAEMRANVLVIITAVFVLIVCMSLPYWVDPNSLRTPIKIGTLIAGCLSALLWYRASVAPIPEFPLGFDLLDTSPQVHNFRASLLRSANLNRAAAAFTAIAAAGAAYDWHLEKFWQAAS